MNKTLLINFGVAVLVAAVSLGAYGLWYGYVNGLAEDVVSLETDIAAKDLERIRTSTARAGEADLVAEESFVATHVVQTADIVSFLEKLEQTGKTFGATVHVASVSGEEKSADGRISLSLSITGSFDAVMRTLGAIEYGTYANMVSDLTLDTVDVGNTWSATGVFVVSTVRKETTP